MTRGYLRYPHVHDTAVVFVADDDLWLTSTDGGRAHRLTADGSPPRSPRFSPDGTSVAFVSGVNGGQDLYVVDLDGGRRRLTWVGAKRMLVSGWLDATHILLASDHADGNRAMTSLFSVSLDGDLERLPWGPAMAAAVHGDGRVVLASPNFQGPERWKRYRGGMAVRLWISDKKRKNWERLLPEQTASLALPSWVGDRVMFTSDLGASLPGKPGEQAQVYSVGPRKSDLRQHTRHSFEDGYVRDASTDGTRVVYHTRGQLFVMDSLDAKPRRIDVSTALGAPEPLVLAPTDRLEAVVPDHGGDGSLLDWRGSAWFLTHRGGPARALSDLPGVRIREPQVLGTSGRGIWATDAEGEDALEIAALDADGESRRIAHGKLGRVLGLASNADGTKVAVASHDGTVHVVDTAKGDVKKVGRSSEGEATGLIFSPDSRYLVWREAVANEGMLGRLVGYDLKQDAGFELTRGQFNDYAPSFSHDGKYLYFLSSRTIDPTYDELTFDLSFTNTVRPFVVPLRAEDPVPFGPSSDGWAISESDDGGTKSAKDEKAKPEPVVLDLAGFEDRMLPLPVPSGRYTSLQTSANGVLWRRMSSYTGELGSGKVAGDETKDSVEFYDVSKRKLSVVVETCDSAVVSGDGKQLVVRNGDDIFVQPAETKPEPEDDAHVTVDLSRLRRRINPRDEWRQMFDENARLMRDHYWREDMDGVGWAGVCAAYRPLVERLASHDDLIDVLWETVGELNTSHAYVFPPADGEAPGTGWLGAEFSRNRKGEVTITRILPGESSDPSARSPLRAAGVGAQPGDVVVAVDGRPTADVPDIGVLMQGAAEKVVELSLMRGEKKRRVAVVPLHSEASLHYHEWVAGRAAYVSKKSGGRIGYVHVPDMAAHGWAEFHRLIEAATRCDAVIADVRFNGGGHTSELVIERLARKVIGWGFGRHFDKPFTYPSQGLRGPVVFVTNPYAGSDGDIVTGAAQNMGLGTVVGERSWGGVIGIDGRFSLVDGTEVTQPRYAHAFKKQGYGLENHGTDPDVVVPMGPMDWESEDDIQLDAAIDEVMKSLKATPAATPPAIPKSRV